MLDRRQLISAIGVGAWPFFDAAAALAQVGAGSGAEAAGKVANVAGSARGRRGGNSRTLQTGEDIFVGERLQTLEASRLRADLGAATRLFMGENTRIMIDRHLVRRGGAIHLSSGALMFERKEPDPKPPVVILSPFAKLAVRGTSVFAGPSSGVFGIFVQDGLVVVSNAAGTVTLRPGQGTNIARPGARPTAPTTWSAARIDAALASVR